MNYLKSDLKDLEKTFTTRQQTWNLWCRYFDSQRFCFGTISAKRSFLSLHSWPRHSTDPCVRLKSNKSLNFSFKASPLELTDVTVAVASSVVMLVVEIMRRHNRRVELIVAFLWSCGCRRQKILKSFSVPRGNSRKKNLQLMSAKCVFVTTTSAESLLAVTDLLNQIYSKVFKLKCGPSTKLHAC